MSGRGQSHNSMQIETFVKVPSPGVVAGEPGWAGAAARGQGPRHVHPCLWSHRGHYRAASKTSGRVAAGFICLALTLPVFIKRTLYMMQTFFFVFVSWLFLFASGSCRRARCASWPAWPSRTTTSGSTRQPTTQSGRTSWDRINQGHYYSIPTVYLYKT